jgi:hypothetical protein
MAISDPSHLAELITPAGDGGYLIHISSTTAYHITATVGSNQAHIGPNGALYPLLLEKAEASLLGGMDRLNGGWMTTVTNLGINCTSIFLPSTDAAMMALIDTNKATHTALTIGTNGSIIDGAPLIASHCEIITDYTIASDGSVTYSVQQPWGVAWKQSGLTILNFNNDAYASAVLVS